jgi:hypothetical protein
MVPLRVHMLSIDYQNYQIQKIKVINKTGHPAIERHKRTLKCQPIQLLRHTIHRCQRLGLTAVRSNYGHCKVQDSAHLLIPP